MPDDVELLRRAYALFQWPRHESVLAAMHSEVVWANGTEGVNGRDEVGLYWKRQSAIIDPHVEPLGFQLKRSVYEEQLLAILLIDV